MKSMDCKEIRREMVLCFAGEGDEARVLRHLETCPHCTRQWRQLQELQVDLDAMEKKDAARMDDLDWDALALDITRRAMRPATPEGRTHRRWVMPLAATLFGMGLLTGYLVFHREAVLRTRSATAVQLADSIRLVETAMDRREIVDFLGRTRTLLAEMVHCPSADCDGRILADTAGRLLQEYRFLGLNLSGSSIQAAQGVMQRLSWVLTELAYDPPPSPERIAALQRLVERERLLLKVRLIERELETPAREV